MRALLTAFLIVVTALLAGATSTINVQINYTFTPLHTYFMAASSCSDRNNGLSPATPWCTPNHNVVCGDVIIAAPGAYSSANGLGTFGSVSSCPSTTGGIDNAGGIYFAVVLCAGDLASCTINYSGGAWAVWVTSNNWAVEGFTVTGNGGQGAFAADGHNAKLHHIAFINNIAYAVGIGFAGLDNGVDHSVPGTVGYDYTAFIGNIAQNAELNIVCTAAIVMVAPASVDNNPGTHYLIYGNFSFNHPPNGCPSDIEDYMFDTWDAHGVTTQAVLFNNIGWSAYRPGFEDFTQNFNTLAGATHVIENNTMFNDSLNNVGFTGDLDIQNNSKSAFNINIFNNIALQTQSNNCGVKVGGASGSTLGTLANINTGTPGNENVFFSLNGSHTCAFDTYVFSANNFLTNPNFTNTTDLLNNRSGAPNCSGFTTTTACMGYNLNTQTLTIPSVISDLTPTCANCAGKGYQKPAAKCPSSGAVATLYPTWLKGVVYLHWTGSQVLSLRDLVTVPCNL